MLDKIKGKKPKIRGLIYTKLHHDHQQVQLSRTGQLLFNMRNSGYPKFNVVPSRSIITLPPSSEIRTKSIVYPLIKPYAYSSIKYDPSEGIMIYDLIEPKLNENEKYILEKLRDGLIQIIDVSLGDIKHKGKMMMFLEKNIERLIDEYNFKLKPKEYVKVMYFIFRDLVGLNKIEPLLSDPYIEDIGCLPEHEKMFARIDGRTVLTDIRSLVDCEITSDGPAIERPSKRIEVISFNPSTMRTEYKNVIGLLRKQNNHGYYFDIRTQGGNHASVSPDHPMIILTSDGLTIKKADEINEGDYVLRLKGSESGQGTRELDLIEEFSKLNIGMRVKGAKILIKNNLEVSKLLGVSNRLVALWKQSDSMPLPAYLKLENDRSMRKSLKISVGQGVKNWLPAVIETGGDFATFLGLFLAEGYYETSGVSLAFGKHEKELHKLALDTGKIFGTTTSLVEHKTATVAYFGGKTLRILFSDILKAGNNSYNKRVPDIVYEWDNTMLENLVRGYFLGDGYIRISDKTKKAVIATASRDLTLGIRFICYKLGIYTRLDERNRKFANTWEISIEHGSLEKFSRDLLKRYFTASSRNSSTQLYPNFLSSSKYYKDGRIGLETALKSENKLMHLLINGDVHPVKIVEKRRVEYDKYFYDIEVEGNHNFMHGDFIFTHNCDGVGINIYVVHQKFGSIKTNIVYNDAKELREFVTKLAERCDRYISYADPLLDGTLPDGARVQASLASDVTTRGPTFSIRKFRDEPLSPMDMIRLNTASAEILAYLWYMIESGVNMLIVGGVATGKTSMLNSISFFIPPEAKIVSIEDTRELNLPHENWIPGVARSGFTGSGVGEVTMYELLRESFRQNPDYLIVGEIRGKEAYVMFQGMASGHPSISTIHAGGVDDLMKRLQTKPINLSLGLIESLDMVIVMVHAREKGKSARRVKEIVEIESIDISTGTPMTAKSFVWLPADDTFEYRGNSWLISKVSAEKGIPVNVINKEIAKRRKFLMWLEDNSVKDMKEIAKYMSLYYRNPEKVSTLLSGGKLQDEDYE